tara:strand:- start:2409 stop:2939 length:531 start_codon:yes stop_codon:yes gene_type:complete
MNKSKQNDYCINKVFKNTNIPEDVTSTHILKYLKMSDMLVFGLLTKNLYENINELVFEKAKTIQKNFRIHRITQNYGSMNNFRFLTWGNYHNYMKIYKKNLLYRKILVHKSVENLRNYPYFLINKSMDDLSSRYLIVKDWLNKNFPDDINKVTRRDVLNFLRENRITVREIIYAGW